MLGWEQFSNYHELSERHNSGLEAAAWLAANNSSP